MILTIERRPRGALNARLCDRCNIEKPEWAFDPGPDEFAPPLTTCRVCRGLDADRWRSTPCEQEHTPDRDWRSHPLPPEILAERRRLVVARCKARQRLKRMTDPNKIARTQALIDAHTRDIERIDEQ